MGYIMQYLQPLHGSSRLIGTKPGYQSKRYHQEALRKQPAINYLQLLSSCCEKPRSVKQIRRCKRLPPKLVEDKSNFDGIMFNESKEAGIGIVVQDSSGQVVATMAEKIQKPHSLESLELLVARRAMIFFYYRNWSTTVPI